MSAACSTVAATSSRKISRKRLRSRCAALRAEAGVWEIFIPRIGPGEVYKFEITHASGAVLPWKADPLARATECPPKTGSVVAADLEYAWRDGNWMASRAARHAPDAPISIYEVHITSWLKGRHDGPPDWQAAGDLLIAHVRDLGFTREQLPEIAARYDGTGPISTNPRPVASPADIVEILELAW